MTDRPTPSRGAADGVGNAGRVEATEEEVRSRKDVIDDACLDRAGQMTDPGYDYGRRFARSDWYALAAATAVFVVLMYVGFFL